MGKSIKDKTYHHGDLKNALIEAGIAILAEDGVHGLSLRKVAGKAGVSHAAPYAHFADKQALIAAISADGHRRIFGKVSAIVERFPDNPLRQLVATAWAYVEFGFQEPALFKTTFSGAVEQEHSYPALVEMTQKNFRAVRQIVERCQDAGILSPGDPDLTAVSVWGLVHGFVSLIQEGQVSHALLDHYSLREMLVGVLSQISRVPIGMDAFGE